MLLSAFKKITFAYKSKCQSIEYYNVAGESNNENSGHFKCLAMTFGNFIARIALCILRRDVMSLHN